MLNHKVKSGSLELEIENKKIKIISILCQLSSLLNIAIERNAKSPQYGRLLSDSLANIKNVSKVLLLKTPDKLIYSDHDNETKKRIRLMIIELAVLIDEEIENILPVSE